MSYFRKMSQCDAMIDLIINIGHRDLYIWSSDFSLYLEVYLIVECHILGQ